MTTFSASADAVTGGRSPLPPDLPGHVPSALAAPVDRGSRGARAAMAPGSLR